MPPSMLIRPTPHPDDVTVAPTAAFKPPALLFGFFLYLRSCRVRDCHSEATATAEAGAGGGVQPLPVHERRLLGQEEARGAGQVTSPAGKGAPAPLLYQWTLLQLQGRSLPPSHQPPTLPSGSFHPQRHPPLGGVANSTMYSYSTSSAVLLLYFCSRLVLLLVVLLYFSVLPQCTSVVLLLYLCLYSCVTHVKLLKFAFCCTFA